MTKVFEKRCFEVFYNPELNVMEAIWINPGEEILEDEFKECISELAYYAIEYRIGGFICDTREYFFVINPEVQVWHDEIIVPQFIRAGIEKIVFVVNDEDMFSNLSIEQTFEEKKAQGIETIFLGSMEHARNCFEKTKKAVTN